MARYRKNPGTAPTANPKVDRDDVKKLREAMRNRAELEFGLQNRKTKIG